MSLRLLIDEDSQAKLLVDLLKIAGHDVVTINELELSGSDDTIVLDCARKQERVLLTQNCRDFEALHQLNSSHPGILAIYQDNYSPKDMRFKDIVKAIAEKFSNFIQHLLIVGNKEGFLGFRHLYQSDRGL